MKDKDIVFDELLKRIPNKYLLTVIAGKRARELYNDLDDNGKETIVRRVLTEILEGKIVVSEDNNTVESKNE